MDMPRGARRLLGVIYILAAGRTDVSVRRDQIALYMKTYGVMAMTDAEWEAHVRPHVDAAIAARPAPPDGEGGAK